MARRVVRENEIGDPVAPPIKKVLLSLCWEPCVEFGPVGWYAVNPEVPTTVFCDVPVKKNDWL